jgi:outer membrane protein OmpA-like peptidoglycan-associated protein
MLTKLLGLGGLASLFYFPFMCTSCIEKGQSISGTLKNAVAASVGVKGVTVAADGRDIILTGHVPNQIDKDKAGAAAFIPGVRAVDNRLTIQPDASTIQAEINKILISKKIEFATGRDVILPVSTPVLDEVLKVLNQAPDLTLRIEGHTDDQGNAVKNRALSQARAQAVVNWFGQHGIAAARMKAAGYGPDKPIAENSTPDGRAKNRRVEILANDAVVVN